MSNFSFRLRFILAQHTALNVAKPELELPSLDSDMVLRMRSAKKDVSIADARELVLEASGWPSEEKATEAGARCRDALMFACARSRIGVDLGNRPPRSMITRAGLDMLQRQTGSRVLNDIHGQMIYETEPKPRFASAHADFVVGTPADRFEKTFQVALQAFRPLSNRERLGFELFNSSFFQRSSDARLLLLVMAFESLLEPKLRSPQMVEHVEQLIDTTRRASGLSPHEQDSLVGSLGWLRYESIRQMGRRFATEQLGSREYLSKTPADFFDHCYHLRSRLVHGSLPAPTDQELGEAVATLEVFVSDILIGDLRDVK